MTHPLPFALAIAESGDLQDQLQLTNWIFGLIEAAHMLELMTLDEAEEWDDRARGAIKGYRT